MGVPIKPYGCPDQAWYMTPGQIADIVTIHQIFSDYVTETSEYADMMLESELEILKRVRRE